MVCFEEDFVHRRLYVYVNEGSKSPSMMDIFPIRYIHSDISLAFIHSINAIGKNVKDPLFHGSMNSAGMLSLEVRISSDHPVMKNIRRTTTLYAYALFLQWGLGLE